MIEAARELMDIVKHAPEYTLWVLLGILFYKVFIAGSWIMVVRLLIIKLHDYMKDPKRNETILKHEMCGKPVNEAALAKLESAMILLRTRNSEDPNRFKSEYIHESDAIWLSEAIVEKKNREVKNK